MEEYRIFLILKTIKINISKCGVGNLENKVYLTEFSKSGKESKSANFFIHLLIRKEKLEICTTYEYT